MLLFGLFHSFFCKPIEFYMNFSLYLISRLLCLFDSVAMIEVVIMNSVEWKTWKTQKYISNLNAKSRFCYKPIMWQWNQGLYLCGEEEDHNIDKYDGWKKICNLYLNFASLECGKSLGFSFSNKRNLNVEMLVSEYGVCFWMKWLLHSCRWRVLGCWKISSIEIEVRVWGFVLILRTGVAAAWVVMATQNLCIFQSAPAELCDRSLLNHDTKFSFGQKLSVTNRGGFISGVAFVAPSKSRVNWRKGFKLFCSAQNTR